VHGKVSARYIGGADYSLLPDEPAPGIRKTDVAPFVVLNGQTVASAVPAQVAAVARCESPVQTATFAYDGLIDGSPQASVTVTNSSAVVCSMAGGLALKALDASGAALPVPTNGVLAPARVTGVLQPHAGNAMSVTIDGDPSTNLCAQQAVMTPARLVVSVGGVSVSVANKATKAVQGHDGIFGCPGRIYAGAADIQ